MRILIAEDEDEIFEVEYVILTHHRSDLTIDRAINAEQLESMALRAEPHDLVVSDNRMRGSLGVDAIRNLRKAGYDVPIVMLTGDADYQQTRANALAAGATEVYSKPILASTLTQIVDKYNPVAVG